jgi:hypothetical protein
LSPIRKIAILVHERDRRARRIGLIALLLADEWASRGIGIELLQGIDRVVDADLLLPQIDLSVVPDAYLRYFEHYPRVINRRVVDIRKSTISTIRVRPGDGWEGPVIVKSDLNYGGYPEMRLARIDARLRNALKRAGREIRRLGRPRAGKQSPHLVTAPLNPHHYPVFDHANAVPEAVFRNPALIVERFLREASPEGYTLRSYNFLGDRGFARRRVSAQPIVKASNSRLLDAPSVPRQLVEFRHRLGFDFGKIDYVELDGAPVVLDINTTPTVVDGSERLARDLRSLAPGIEALAIDG